MVMNFDKEGWALEHEDGVIMDQGKSEHIREAAQVISQYCDIIAIRAFASLTDRETRNRWPAENRRRALRRTSTCAAQVDHS